jgi:DNA invertase Pin-like site-specific DNA recombinase
MINAVAYTRDIALAQTGEIIHSSSQVEQIKNFAAENGMEIIAWFTDGVSEADLLKRPGIQALLAYDQPYSRLVCERVWALSRSMAVLEPFIKELDQRGVRLESATPMWDYVSQQCRRRSKSMPFLPPASEFPDDVEIRGRYRVAKPAQLNFVHLVHHVRAISARL